MRLGISQEAQGAILCSAVLHFMVNEYRQLDYRLIQIAYFDHEDRELYEKYNFFSKSRGIHWLSRLLADRLNQNDRNVVLISLQDQEKLITDDFYGKQQTDEGCDCLHKNLGEIFEYLFDAVTVTVPPYHNLYDQYEH